MPFDEEKNSETSSPELEVNENNGANAPELEVNDEENTPQDGDSIA